MNGRFLVNRSLRRIRKNTSSLIENAYLLLPRVQLRLQTPSSREERGWGLGGGAAGGGSGAGRRLEDMATPETPACYSGVTRQSAAFRLMKQMVLHLYPLSSSGCFLSSVMISVMSISTLDLD